MKQFETFYLGVVRDINMGSSRRRDKEAQLVDQIEAAQVIILSSSVYLQLINIPFSNNMMNRIEHMKLSRN